MQFKKVKIAQVQTQESNLLENLHTVDLQVCVNLDSHYMISMAQHRISKRLKDLESVLLRKV